MQRIEIGSDLIHRIGSDDGRTARSRNQLRAELDQQIADYENAGGKINSIPRGVSANEESAVLVSGIPGENMATCRPSPAQIRAANYNKDLYFSTEEAANYIGMSCSAMRMHTRNGTLSIDGKDAPLKCAKKHLHGNLYLKTDVAAAKKYYHPKSVKKCSV